MVIANKTPKVSHKTVYLLSIYNSILQFIYVYNYAYEAIWNTSPELRERRLASDFRKL